MKASTRLLALLALATPIAASATPQPFDGVLELRFPTRGTISVAATGSVVVNGPGGLGHLSSLALQVGAFAGAGSFPVSDFPLNGIAATLANGAGTLAPVGALAVGGMLRLCIFLACNASPPGAITVPLTLHGTRGVGLGGAPITVVQPAAFNVTLQGAPWTTGTATLGGFQEAGFVHGPLSGGASSAANESGVVRLVTPIALQTSLGQLPSIPAFGVLQIHIGIVPEPHTMLMVASGVVVLAAFARRERRE